jgi:hypothetical protein
MERDTGRHSQSSTEKELLYGGSINLWDYLSKLRELNGKTELKTESIFKLSKPEKRFI